MEELITKIQDVYADCTTCQEVAEVYAKQDSVICDLGAACVKTVLLVANDGANSKNEVLIRNGMLMRQLVEYLDKSIEMSDQIGSEN